MLQKHTRSPKTVDLAIIITPSKTTPRILKEIGKKGMKRDLIISAVYGENGNEGRKLDKKIQHFKRF